MANVSVGSATACWSWSGCRRAMTEPRADRLLERLLNYRVFADEAGKMNLSLLDTAVVCCWCRSSRSRRTPARAGVRFFQCRGARPRRAAVRPAAAGGRSRGQVAGGRFGADMQVSLVNDGPVTFGWMPEPQASCHGMTEIGVESQRKSPSDTGSHRGRSASIERNTLETQIKVSVDLDGTGASRMDTGAIPRAHARSDRTPRADRPGYRRHG